MQNNMQWIYLISKYIDKYIYIYLYIQYTVIIIPNLLITLEASCRSVVPWWPLSLPSRDPFSQHMAEWVQLETVHLHQAHEQNKLGNTPWLLVWDLFIRHFGRCARMAFWSHHELQWQPCCQHASTHSSSTPPFVQAPTWSRWLEYKTNSWRLLEPPPKCT